VKLELQFLRFLIAELPGAQPIETAGKMQQLELSFQPQGVHSGIAGGLAKLPSFVTIFVSCIMDPLPIDAHIDQILALLKSANSLILSAPPGSGKTTRIPRALLKAGYADPGEILILEPRRIAARLACSRVASELGEKPGETVGYSIRYETAASAGTRIRFLTEAILSRRMIQDPDLSGVSAVILDEFHERHIATDLALALLKPLQKRRPNLKIVIMSATLNADPIASFLGAEQLAVPGSRYDLEIEHEEKIVTSPLPQKVYSAVSKLLKDGVSGDILVFLPGAAEIRQSADILAPLIERYGILVYPLHGDLPSTEQLHAIAPTERTKVILATNVAETSITIPGVAAVIDSGLARVAGHSAWSGFPTLATARISKSSAIQRAGRAGRTQAGRAIRLYTRHDYESRPEFDIPELKRSDLAETTLMLHGAGIRNVRAFGWFDPPPDAAIEAAETLLADLGAIEKIGSITEIGKRMLRLPVHPRLSRLIIEGENLDARDAGMLVAALLSEKDIRLNFRSKLGSSKRSASQQVAGQSDILELLDCFRQAERAHFDSEYVQTLGLDLGALYAVKRAHQHLLRISAAKSSAKNESNQSNEEEAVMIAALSAFPDRVAKRRKTGSREILLAGGGSADLSPNSAVQNPELLLAIDAEEKRNKTSATNTLVRIASGIEPEWLAGLFPESISQEKELKWNERANRVDEISKTVYRQLKLDETIRSAPPSEEASRLLFSAVFSDQLNPFRDASLLAALRARMELIANYYPKESFPAFDDSALNNLIAGLCKDRTSFEELKTASLIHEILLLLNDRQRRLIDRETPERVQLNRGRWVKVHYETGKPPWIESRLQDFFGMNSTPAICSGRAPLTLHLLAPSGRPVQITQDLAGFWERHYPEIGRELQRRYPKHAWPEIINNRKS
jgi:ATP-dependent helicase HrpB